MTKRSADRSSHRFPSIPPGFLTSRGLLPDIQRLVSLTIF